MQHSNFDRLELFQPGSKLTSLSAEEINRRIVRPLNVLLRTVAKPPLKLLHSDAGLYLYDTTQIVTAVGSNSPITAGGACALPDVSELIGLRIDTDGSGFILLTPDVDHTFSCAYVIEIDFEASVPRWKPSGAEYRFVIRDDGAPGNLKVLAEASDEGIEEMQTVTGTVQLHIDHSTVNEFDFFWSAFGYDDLPIGYCEIQDARFISSTP